MKQLKQLILSVALVASVPAWAVLPESSVSYQTVGEPLYVTVRNLEKTLNTRIVVKDLDLDKQVKGNYVGYSGFAFVAEFAKRNNFAWDYSNNTVTLAPYGADLTPKRDVKSKDAAPSSFSKVVFDPKDPNKNGLMIFQIHNASVEDRRVLSGKNTKVVKGVATLFGEFIGAPTRSSVASKDGNGGSVTPMKNESIKFQNNLMSLFTKNAPQASGGDAPEADPNVVNGSGRGVYADSRLNAVLVRDKVSNFEAYKQIIALLDRPSDMVQLEAFIVDVQKTKMDSLGINLGISGDTRSGGLILSAFSRRNLLSKINAMEATGEAESLSVPSVVSLNNEQALFSARQNFFMKVAGAYDANVQQVTAETQLLVTPQIANESADVPYDQRRVKLLINVQDASVDTSNKELPSTTENQINTQAVVRSGDSLVIGGQIVRKSSKDTQGLPGTTSTDSFFGRLLSQRTSSEVEYVRMYIVRPLILGEDSYSATAAKVN